MIGLKQTKSNGITLIALVITIIVVILVSGATIALIITTTGVVNEPNQINQENINQNKY